MFRDAQGAMRQRLKPPLLQDDQQEASVVHAQSFREFSSPLHGDRHPAACPMTAHGFRSTASSLLNESGNWPPDVIKHALAHQDKNAIRAIYNRTSYWNARVEMMRAWSDQLDALKKQAAGLSEGPKSEAPSAAPKGPYSHANDCGPAGSHLAIFSLLF
ncbi:hypothetical protein J2W22_001656 [Sphingomonas kyeonggiensis]|uniref:tyrosine-type recombinase/integrase n=1 Tax=Sphingomonas kyeonggiensis TaxID=1268553 RepID=UPI002781DF7D|nr:hypothetical protein [Sphingomonas kyeonggiensis]MDQ0249609.1 hypothetical protein [Sphingomonas kyeonggiensis]